MRMAGKVHDVWDELDFEIAYDALDAPEFADLAWLAAVKAADCWRDKVKPTPRKKSGDMSKLVALLRHRFNKDPDQIRLTRQEWDLLIDLLSRHSLKLKSGQPQLPIYKENTWTEFTLKTAAEFVNLYMEKGHTAEKAVEKVGSHFTPSSETLLAHVKGRLGSTRRRSKMQR